MFELIQFAGIVGAGLLIGLLLTALENVLVKDGDLRE